MVSTVILHCATVVWEVMVMASVIEWTYLPKVTTTIQGNVVYQFCEQGACCLCEVALSLMINIVYSSASRCDAGQLNQIPRSDQHLVCLVSLGGVGAVVVCFVYM